jgi:hypothetical protein
MKAKQKREAKRKADARKFGNKSVPFQFPGAKRPPLDGPPPPTPTGSP